MTTAKALGAPLAEHSKKFDVVLHAQNIEVTATTDQDARKYAREDAFEFSAKSNLTVGRVMPARPGTRLRQDLAPAAMSVALRDVVPDVGDDKVYNFAVTFSFTVEAANGYEAGASALALATHPDHIDERLRLYREATLWRKALPLARPVFYKIANSLPGFHTTFGDGRSAAPALWMQLAQDGVYIGELALVPVQRKRDFSSPSAPVDVGLGLSFTDSEGRQTGYYAPKHLPDIWFNDAIVREQDIDCLKEELIVPFVATHLQSALSDQVTDLLASYGHQLN